jgi:hypothetical protein
LPQFEDRRAVLFGREAEIQYLTERARSTGLTALAGRPVMGKSWTLNEVARRLTEDGVAVGFAESFGETHDLLLRAVKDLYVRWLEDATAFEQAKVVWSQQKSNLLPGVTKAVSAVFKEAVAKPIGVAVEQAFNGLLTANQDLKSGGLVLPPLQYEQARDLIAVVAAVRQTGVAIFLDQWEKSPDPKAEARILDSFVRHCDDGPHCHITVGLRPDHPAFDIIQDVHDVRPGRAEIRDLPELNLADEAERDRLLNYLHDRHPVTREVDDEQLFALIGGYPGVIYRWADFAPESLDALTQQADDAQNYRFSELAALLGDTLGDARALAIRLALTPLGTTDTWDALRPQIMDGIDPAALDDLVTSGVLEQREPPGFGHAKRHEYALAWLSEHSSAQFSTQVSGLTRLLAGAIRDSSASTKYHATVLSGLKATARITLPDDPLPLALSVAAISLFDWTSFGDEDLDNLVAGAHTTCYAENAPLAALVAIALYNTGKAAKAEDDLERRDGLLQALRDLATAWPRDASVRLSLVTALFNTSNDATVENDLEQRGGLLQELWGLVMAWPQDASVREILTMALFNTCNAARAEGDFDRRDGLLQELRDLATVWPQDAVVREPLAKALYNTIHYSNAEDELERRNSLLLELQGLATAWPKDSTVRGQLAKALFNMCNATRAEDDLPRRNGFLQELRNLATAWPQDAAVRGGLAKALFNTGHAAQAEDDLELRDDLLQEVRDLATDYPEDEILADVIQKIDEWLGE